MMSTAQRAEFLAQSSKLLSFTSQSSSAHLSLSRIELQRETRKPESGPADDDCQTCGSSSISLKTVWPKQNSRRTNVKTKMKRERLSTTGRILIESCSKCGRTTKSLLNAPRRTRSIEENKIMNTLEKQVFNIPTKEGTVDTKTTGKKRAKARKDRAGLQALLDQSKLDVKPQSSLNLMDFMNSGWN